MAKFGGSEFTAFSVPLVFGNRAFLLEPGSPPLLTVLVEHEGKVYGEIVKNEPGDTPISTVEKWPNGYVVVGDRASGSFVYKVRPAYETSVVFGMLKGEDGAAVKITDRYIEFGQGNRVQQCTFDGAMAGVIVHPDGSAGIGAPLSATLRNWLAARNPERHAS